MKNKDSLIDILFCYLGIFIIFPLCKRNKSAYLKNNLKKGKVLFGFSLIYIILYVCIKRGIYFVMDNYSKYMSFCNTILNILTYITLFFIFIYLVYVIYAIIKSNRKFKKKNS